MLVPFNEFFNNLVVEALHPELQKIIQTSSGSYVRPKQSVLANTIRTLTQNGQKTGVEGNMPKGSSRAYLKKNHIRSPWTAKNTTLPPAPKSPFERNWTSITITKHTMEWD
jgi:hypothetical protein